MSPLYQTIELDPAAWREAGPLILFGLIMLVGVIIVIGPLVKSQTALIRQMIEQNQLNRDQQRTNRRALERHTKVLAILVRELQAHRKRSEELADEVEGAVKTPLGEVRSEIHNFFQRATPVFEVARQSGELLARVNRLLADHEDQAAIRTENLQSVLEHVLETLTQLQEANVQSMKKESHDG